MADISMLSPTALINIDTAKSIFRDRLSAEEQTLYVRMPREQLEEMREFFDLFDDNQSGNIPNADIMKVMNALGENPTQEKVEDLVQQIDYDSDGMIDFDEFTCLMVKQMRDVDCAEEELVAVFKKFDKDEDGEIGHEDLMIMMRELGNDMEIDDAKDMIHMFDVDGNGGIKFQEFVMLMMYDTQDTTIFD